MTIKAIIFDIGGVLEITPKVDVDEQWEQKLGLKAGELNERLYSIWRGGSIGTITETDVHKGIGEIMDWSVEQVAAYMADIWKEYLGTLNVDLAAYFRALRPRYKTAIISNSFVGAREKEAVRYHFDEMCDSIIYSHEVGFAKPDPRIYQLACQHLGVQPAEALFLDDREAAVTGAQQVGMHAIVFSDNAQAIAAIEACIATNNA